MSNIFKLLLKLNIYSPFRWEIKTNGYSFTVLCEEGEVHDPETDAYLNDLSLEECEEWLWKIIMERMRYDG